MSWASDEFKLIARAIKVVQRKMVAYPSYLKPGKAQEAIDALNRARHELEVAKGLRAQDPCA